MIHLGTSRTLTIPRGRNYRFDQRYSRSYNVSDLHWVSRSRFGSSVHLKQSNIDYQNFLKRLELEPDKLRWRCDPQLFTFETTQDSSLSECTGIIGHDAAMRTLEVGLRMDRSKRDFNIHLTGLGLSATAICEFLSKLEAQNKLPFSKARDHLLIYNFDNPETPIHLTMAAGEGKKFEKDIKNFLELISDHISVLFQSQPFLDKREDLMLSIDLNHFQIEHDFKQIAKHYDFTVSIIKDDDKKKENKKEKKKEENSKKPTSSEDANTALVKQRQQKEEKEEKKERKEKRKNEDDEERIEIITRFEFTSKTGPDETQLYKLQRQIEKYFESAVKKTMRKKTEALDALERDTIYPFLHGCIQDLQDKYSSIPEIETYLNKMEESILSNPTSLLKGSVNRFPMPQMSLLIDKNRATLTHLPLHYKDDEYGPPKIPSKFLVHLLVDNANATNKKRIVVQEAVVSGEELFGSVAHKKGADFSHVVAGSILRADGGYLVLSVDPHSGWIPHLLHVLQTHKLRILNTRPRLNIPHIPLDVKFILLDPHAVLSHGQQHECTTNNGFNVTAHFDHETHITKELLLAYASFVKTTCRKMNLLPFHRSGVEAVIENAVALTDSGKLSLLFSRDILEAIHLGEQYAKHVGATRVTAEHVRQALEEKRIHVKHAKLEVLEEHKRGLPIIKVEGKATGIVNSLAIIEHSDRHAIGCVGRTSCITSVGTQGLINIDGHIKLSGEVHQKGFHIVAGLLRHLYAQEFNLTMHASITAEQTYDEIDGDSDSIANCCVVLSSLAKLPLRQDIACTGSMNQFGEVQPVGGVTSKVEAFYDVCKARGLNGQGVIIPLLNQPDLSLTNEIVEACRESKFHVYGVETLDEALYILTGVQPGNIHQENTVHWLVYKELQRLHEKGKLAAQLNLVSAQYQ